MHGSRELVSRTVKRIRRVVTAAKRSEFIRALSATRAAVEPDEELPVGVPGRAKGSSRDSVATTAALRSFHRRMSSRRVWDSGSVSSRSPYSTPAKKACMP